MTPIDAEIGGYAEVRGAYDIGQDGVPWILAERVRPQFTISGGPRITGTAVVEASLTQGRDNVEEVENTLLANDDAADMLINYCEYTENDPYDVVSDYLRVERLYLDVNLEKVDLKIGRQAVNWGSALVFHPTDLYNEILVTEPWRERQGVNAVKATVPLGAHQAQVLVAADDDLSHFWSGDTELEFSDLPFSAAAKFTLVAADTDWSLVGFGRTDGTWFGGVDLKGTLGVGWWVEGGFHGKKNEDDLALDINDDGAWTGGAGAPEVVVGVDYSFAVLERFYLAAEYRYDGSGSSPEDYNYTARTTGVDIHYDCTALTATAPEEARSTLGIHYIDAAVNLAATRDFTIQTAVVYNLLDGTGVIVPDVSYTLGDHWAIHLGAQVPFGEDGEYRPPAEALAVTTSKFTVDMSGLLYDAALQGWVRYSF